MNIISYNSKLEKEVKKSKFISFLYKVESIDEVNDYLNQLKKTYNDATHICYAYIINSNMKYNDDNEPSGTAGVPILNVLKKHDLNYVLAVVVRYFGGIKLGSSNLLRTYLNITNENIKQNNIKKYIEEERLVISCPYDNLKLLNNLIKDYLIVSKNFDELVTYEIIIDKIKINEFKKSLLNTNIIIKEKKN